MLGGNHIHLYLDRRFDTLCRSICRASHTDRQVAQAIVAKNPLDPVRKVRDHHTKCCLATATTHSSPLTNLDLLLVCREINNEAALLPFQTNTFICGSSPSLHQFGRRLIPIQKQAVVSISLYATGRLERTQIAKFTGLQHLTVLMEAQAFKVYRSPSFYLQLPSFPHEIFRTLNFKGWKSAVICILDKHPGTGLSKASEFEEQAREWEKLLLEPWDEQAHQARLAAERKGSLRKGEVRSYRV